MDSDGFGTLKELVEVDQFNIFIDFRIEMILGKVKLEGGGGVPVIKIPLDHEIGDVDDLIQSVGGSPHKFDKTA